MFYDGAIADKRILLHACCGPCSLGAIEPLMSDGAHITLLFYNPCIENGEYELRLRAIERVAEHYGLPLAAAAHEYSAYWTYASEYAAEREGGARCALCMADRLEYAARYALSHGFDAYTTTLTVSPHKNSRLIFSLAKTIDEDGVGAPFLPRDFKKRDGFLLSTRLTRELGIYRQSYCGCEFSRRDYSDARAAQGGAL